MKGLLCDLQADNHQKCTKEEDQDDEDLCVVCWERAREVIFYHCMHMVRACNTQGS